jgi:hypothetical protein
MLAHELALCSTIITLQQTQTKFDLKQKKKDNCEQKKTMGKKSFT